MRDRRTGGPDASVGHIVSERGRPPDFMMEVASPCAARVDAGAQRDDHAALVFHQTVGPNEAGALPIPEGPERRGCGRISLAHAGRFQERDLDGLGVKGPGWPVP